MTNQPTLEKKKTLDVPCGNAVIVDTDNGAVVCMKAEREGKEYIHHYAVPLHPVTETTMALIYLDPDQEIVDCTTQLSFTLSEQDANAAPVTGQVFKNFQGTYLKVHEDPKSQKMYAYLNLETGQIQRRQEKKMEAVYTTWNANGGSTELTLVAMYSCHCEGSL